MNITIIAPALPPLLDGIGDYSAILAKELSKSAQVTVLTKVGEQYTSMDGIKIVPLFDPAIRSSVWNIAQYVRANKADWVMLQYNSFSYGKWGLNLSLPRMIKSIAKTGTRVMLMAHEEYVPVKGLKSLVMTSWQRLQLKQLGKQAHVVGFSIDPWVRKFTPWFKEKRLHHFPVGSNIQLNPTTREQARSLLAIPEDAVVLGLFGTVNQALMYRWVSNAVAEVEKKGYRVCVLYLGPHVEAMRKLLPGVDMVTTGALSSLDVSLRFPAIDVYLSPLLDGVSTRRGTFMAALQHGLPVVGTIGFNTDEMLIKQNQVSAILVPANAMNEFVDAVVELVAHPLKRIELSAKAAEFYQAQFDWPILSRKMLSLMQL